MTSAGRWDDYGRDERDYEPREREPGSRRRKLAGYLKAANELRQTYQQNYTQSLTGRDGSQDKDALPGSYPDSSVASASTGTEEMLIFPSYARRHVKKKPSAIPGTIQETTGDGRDVRDSVGSGDAEFWKQQWDSYEADSAIVDVDVRGWIYTPHAGPLNRRNRVFVGLARQLVGIPAPSPSNSASNSASNSRATSPHGLRQRMDAHNAKHEEQIAAKEADSLLRRGEAEAAVAGVGDYSEKPDDGLDQSDSTGSEDRVSPLYDDPNIKPVQKKDSWNAPAQMSPAELSIANAHLMSRLKPFLANPLAEMPISAFFYNEDCSRQKTIDTDSSGHFTLRAPLDFVPTHVRVLASEGLSATQELQITEPRGVSVISDVDDTVKHSAIGSGAREIFRNVFIRELSDLTVQGVRDLYQKLQSLGVKFHYVSNSPWQLYPLLNGFFTKAGLPPGSFHLKQYSGMLQGIFEPVAERKKGTLERIMQDFPDRRFVLFGDSGEADLEVYTDLVCENPGRILGIFIRDVTTTPNRRDFFDSSMRPPASRSQTQATTDQRLRSSPSDQFNVGVENDTELKAGIAESLKTYGEQQDSQMNTEIDPTTRERPRLPARRQTEPVAEEVNLIDLESDDERPIVARENSTPAVPPKPRGLSSTSTATQSSEPSSRKSAPPIPAKKPVPSSASPQVPSTINGGTKPPENASADAKRRPPPPPPSRLSYRSAARERLNAAYDRLPSPSTHLRSSDTNQPPALPTRKPAPSSSYASSARSYASNLYNTGSLHSAADSSAASGGLSASYGADPAYQTASTNKKAELWERRWARAKAILEDDNVMLKSWRVGTDVLDDAVALVQRAQRDDEKRQRQ